MKLNLNHAWIILMVTLVWSSTLAILAFVSRLIGSPDVTLLLFLLCTLFVYVSLAAGLLVPPGIAVLWLLGGSIERRKIVAVSLLAVLNIAAAITWISLVVPQLQIRY